MTKVFVVRNQLGHYWGKKKRWVDGTVARRVMHVKHEDEGLNLLVELSAKDVELRGEVIPVEMTERGVPVVEPSEQRLEDEDDLAKRAAAQAQQDETAAEEPIESAEEENPAT